MPHLQPGSAPPASTPGGSATDTAGTAEPGSVPSSDDPLTAVGPPGIRGAEAARLGSPRGGPPARAADSLLDDPAGWPAVPTAAGRFQLVPVQVGRDLTLISSWMNDPAVAAFWELAGPEHVTERHLRPQVEGDGRSVPCLGVLDGTPVSYWELYRADLDPLARHCPVQTHDTGVHVLIGGGAERGRGLGTLLLRTVADLVLDGRPRCGRVLAEPDVRNVPSVAAFLGAGFRFGAEIELPAKRAALMVRDRALRHVL
ncbi:acetyltransferase [Streptomyces albus subsp. chlorinus]|uniref:GNAT family N-acetyltransferase n=1 Tax=Streptomyces albus TaxID=1888 RepID=UPI00156DB742|nr:GNAT family N-acetyltransferase [Streptomyces albus]NSC24281.1 acetyltransferase [Streptomyces albus subsp. chlorinus]